MSWELFHQQHRDGWLVYDGARLIAELTLCGTDDPSWIFEVALRSNDPADLSLFTSAKRPLSDKILYKNTISGAIARDRDFLVNIYDSGPQRIRLALRDFRVPGDEDAPPGRETC